MARWMDLPNEIQHSIFQAVAVDSRRSNPPERRLSSFATVCRNWQWYFEQENFRQLILTSARLATLDTNVRHRRNIVRHIWLRIETLEYVCGGMCRRQESSKHGTAVCRNLHYRSEIDLGGPLNYGDLAVCG